jgi:2-polyprenyl-3-methyl-5-hydroxy-6-metoxy-1,4-benzoquinol methylase
LSRNEPVATTRGMDWATRFRAALSPRGNCPLCGRESVDAEVVVPFPDIPVVRCPTCCMTYSAVVADDSSLDAYYREHFGSERHRQGQVINAAINLHVLRRLLDLKALQSVLDVGSGYGYLVRRLCDEGVPRGVGVEPSVEESRHAREKLGVEVHARLLQDAPLQGEKFDALVSFEVIEHLAEPCRFVEQMAGFVNEGGWLIIGTDNFEASVVRRMGPAFPKWIPHTHVSHFCVKTLKRCIELVPGMKVVDWITYTPWELWLSWLRSGRPDTDPNRCFNLDHMLATEMTGRYKGFGLRRWLNPLWFSLTAHRGGNGQMMFMLAQRNHG